MSCPLKTSHRLRKLPPLAVCDPVRAANIERNKRKLAELDFVDLFPPKKTHVATKHASSSVSTRVQPPRSAKRQALTPTPTHEGRTWHCSGDCGEMFICLDCFVTHLENSHKFVLNTELLAPLGLGLCPYCDGVFAGLVSHFRSCKFSQQMLWDSVVGPFPRKCAVWWEGEQTWFEGRARRTAKPFCWRVDYVDKDTWQYERCFRVSFQPQTLTLGTRIDLVASLSAHVSEVACSPVSPLLDAVSCLTGLSEAKQSNSGLPLNTHNLHTSDSLSFVGAILAGTDHGPSTPSDLAEPVFEQEIDLTHTLTLTLTHSLAHTHTHTLTHTLTHIFAPTLPSLRLPKCVRVLV